MRVDRVLAHVATTFTFWNPTGDPVRFAPYRSRTGGQSGGIHSESNVEAWDVEMWVWPDFHCLVTGFRAPARMAEFHLHGRLAYLTATLYIFHRTILTTTEKAHSDPAAFTTLARISHRRSSRGRRDAAVTGGTDRKTAKA